MSKWIWMLVGAALLFGGIAKKAFASDPVVEMLKQKGIITEDDAKKLYESQAKTAPVLTSNAGSKLTVKGRVFAGYFVSEENKDFASKYGSGSNTNYRNGSFEIPDAKIQFTWTPLDRVSLITRLSFSNADNSNLKFDYLYAQYNGIIPDDLKSRLRLGKIKVDFGEETWTDNPVENYVGLISNSATGAVGGYDEGVELYGNFIPGVFGYTLSVSNGNAATGTDDNTSKAIAAKLFVQPIPQIYFSGSYYTADITAAGTTDFKIANITSAPTGAGSDGWTRSVWEADARGKFFRQDEKGNKTEAARLDAAYGEFTDDLNKSSNQDREGSYYFLEGMYNFTPKIYAGARYSVISMDKKYSATMNGIANANEYERTSLGLGYRLNNLVTLKAEYSWNDTSRIDSGTGNKSLSDNLFAVGLAASF